MGRGTILLLASYSDESSTDFPILTVAGYLMTGEQFKALDLAWRAALGELPYFHMNEGHHWKHRKIYGELLKCITPESVTCGISASVDVNAFDLVTKEKRGNQSLKYWFGGAYAYCVGIYMSTVGEWVAANRPEELFVAYFMEAGHERQGEADMFLKLVASKLEYRQTKRDYRYGSHTFIDKKEDPGRVLQCADMLAWHLSDFHKNGGRYSSDLQHLLKVPTHYRHMLPDDIALSIGNQVKFMEGREEKTPPQAARMKQEEYKTA